MNQNQEIPNGYNAFTGEMQMVGFDYAPAGWALCDGKELKVIEYPDLYKLLDNKYGGEKDKTFALPNLKGRFPLGMGDAITTLGKSGGVEEVTLTEDQMPAHRHTYNGINKSTERDKSPKGRFLPVTLDGFYIGPDEDVKSLAMHEEVISISGESKPHTNMPPYLCVNFIICLRGVFPNK